MNTDAPAETEPLDAPPLMFTVTAPGPLPGQLDVTADDWARAGVDGRAAWRHFSEEMADLAYGRSKDVRP